MLRRKKRGKDIRLRKAPMVNIFEGAIPEMFRFTNHFLDRWNERMPNQFKTKEEMEDYIKLIYDEDIVEHIIDSHYLIGDIYVTAIKEKDSILFITTLGTYKDNPVLYNVISSGEYNKTLRQYGKINLAYAM